MITGYGSLCTEFYNLTKPIGGDYPDVPYYIKHLSAIPGRILEAAVGTGRLLIPLLEAGLTVEGVDNSEEMLKCCRVNCRERDLEPVLYSGDIANLDLPQKYHAIIITLGSFMLLETRERAIAALQGFSRHLEPRGQLFIDLEIPLDGLDNQGTVRKIQSMECSDGCWITLESSTCVDPLQQLNISWLRYDKWKNGKLIASELQRFPLHWFGRDEFIMVLRENGYEDIRICANYQDEVSPTRYQDIMCFRAIWNG